MKYRIWILLGAFAALGLGYAVYFTEWFSPAAIEISHQVRFSSQAPTFGRPAPAPKNSKNQKNAKTNNPAVKPVRLPNLAEISTNFVEAVKRANLVIQTNGGKTSVVLRASGGKTNRASHASASSSGLAYAEKGATANVTFSLDDYYALTSVHVEDVPADGSNPTIMWHLKGKSQPVKAFIYGKDLEGMAPIAKGVSAEPLIAGVPYRLILQAGRRRGTNEFTTALVTE